MNATDDDYTQHLLALRPTGPAWPEQDQALSGLAPELARVHNRALDLIEEGDPRTAREALARWEGVTGLPDPCSAGIATTLQERRAAVVARLNATGGQSASYYESLATSLGYSVRITEYRPFVAGWSRCGDRLSGPHPVRFYWRVEILGARVTLFRAGSSQAGDRLGKITRAEDLECLLRRLRPAHTTLVTSYQGT